MVFRRDINADPHFLNFPKNISFGTQKSLQNQKQTIKMLSETYLKTRTEIVRPIGGIRHSLATSSYRLGLEIWMPGEYLGGE